MDVLKDTLKTQNITFDILDNNSILVSHIFDLDRLINIINNEYGRFNRVEILKYDKYRYRIIVYEIGQKPFMYTFVRRLYSNILFIKREDFPTFL